MGNRAVFPAFKKLMRSLNGFQYKIGSQPAIDPALIIFHNPCSQGTE